MIKDNFGNKIIGERVMPFNTYNIFLKLTSGETRKIASLNLNNSTLYIKRSPTKHLFRELNAYAFNYELINNEVFCYNKIIFMLASKKYVFSREFVMENGIFQHHKKAGFELQLFVPKSLMLKQNEK